MARKRIDHKTEYAVTRIGYCVGGDVEKARVMAHRAGRLRSDIWNKYGSLQCWGESGASQFCRSINMRLIRQKVSIKDEKERLYHSIKDNRRVRFGDRTAVARQMLRRLVPGAQASLAGSSRAGPRHRSPKKKLRSQKMKLSREEEKKLKEHLGGIAEILSSHTSGENLESFEKIETVIRDQIQTEIGPKIAGFFLSKSVK